MIEIRTDEHAKPAHVDGGHNHEQTRAIADGISEAVRLLVYATMPEKRGLKYPSDIYSVLGSLAGALHTLPQALQQMSEWTASEVAAGHARENPGYGPHGGNAEAAATALTSALQEAARAANKLGGLLTEGQSATRGLESTRDQDDDE